MPFFITLHRNIKMQDRAFSVTIRPSASDSIIPEVSRGMRMVRDRREGGREEWYGEEGTRKEGRAGKVVRWGEGLGSSTMDCDGPG